jgi:peptidyl-prolyl cis-trans isomerase A (cyclophilin A)
MIRRIAPALLWLAALPALAQETVPSGPESSVAPAGPESAVAPAGPESAPPPAAPTPPPVPKPAVVHVTLTTSEGPIVLELEKERAPVTTANFLRYVDGKRFDGTTFYRAVKVQDGYGLVQGGARNDPKRVFPNIAHEPTSKTGLSHVDGAISMARAAPGTASGDFFIVIGGFPTMNADPTQPGDNLGFAVFGHVSQGMDLIRKIVLAPTTDAGPAEMKGQMLAAPVKIVSARRSD